MSVSAADRHASTLAPPEEYLEVGFNFRMTDLQAAVGIVQLGRLPEAVAHRRQRADEYRDAFDGLGSVRAVADPPWGTSNFQSFWIELLDDFPLSREELLAHLAERGVSARRGIMSAHRQPAYAHHPHGDLSVTERLTDTHSDPADLPRHDRRGARPGRRRRPRSSCGPMNAPLLLVAAGGLARETLEAVRSAGTHDVIGFLDDDEARHGTRFSGVKVLGGMDLVEQHPDAQIVVCAGKGSARASIVTRLESLRVQAERFATVMHPSVHVPGSCVMGHGTVLLAGTALTADVTMGRHVVVMPNAVLTHGDIVEDYATICAGVVLGGDVVVAERAYLGMAAAVRERLLIGADATVGMGSVVLTDVPAGETWAGVPARQLPPPGFRRKLP